MSRQPRRDAVQNGIDTVYIGHISWYRKDRVNDKKKISTVKGLWI
jgi:hypothetical protein